MIRGRRVLLDEDLASLYGVATKALLQAVRRNSDRFPDDFLLELTDAEWAALRSQTVTLEAGRGKHRKYRPFALAEQGVAMLSSVLRSQRAIAVNVQIMRAFVRMPELLSANQELAIRLNELEARLDKKLAVHDEAIAALLSAIRELLNPPVPKSRGIGFTAEMVAPLERSLARSNSPGGARRSHAGSAVLRFDVRVSVGGRAADAEVMAPRHPTLLFSPAPIPNSHRCETYTRRCRHA